MSSENDLETMKECSMNNEVSLDFVLPSMPMVEETPNAVNAMNEPQSDTPKGEEPNLVDAAAPLFEQSTILQGKRSRKPTSRLEISQSTPSKKELHIPQGCGKPLGEIDYINYRITRASTDDLSRLRQICFGRRGVKANLRKNLREFNGFEFDRHNDEYEKHLNHLIKLKKDQLRGMSDILGLPSTGRNSEHAERILNFLIKPTNEGKRVPKRKSSMQILKHRRTISKRSSTSIGNETAKRKAQTNHIAINGDEHAEGYIDKPGQTAAVESLPKRKRSKKCETSSCGRFHEVASTVPQSKLDTNGEKKENEQSSPSNVVCELKEEVHENPNLRHNDATLTDKTDQKSNNDEDKYSGDYLRELFLRF